MLTHIFINAYSKGNLTMKEKAIIIGCYSLLILVGGIIGHLVANSLISLIVSSVIAGMLLVCSGLILRGNVPAYHAATLITAFLLAFFTYRFFLTYKIAPGGIMAMISGILLVYLIMQGKRVASKV
jgi:uncharacterized membrane protein (UPF0136 family)